MSSRGQRDERRRSHGERLASRDRYFPPESERPLSPPERASYYREMAVVAQLFGVPAAVVPPTLDDFRRFFHEQVASDTIAVTDTAREIAAVILRAPLPAPVRLIAPAHRLATAALLPPRLRRQYSLRWTPLHAFVLPSAAQMLKLAAIPALSAAAHLRPRVAVAAA
jgi:uncharacterized protein (DUF2236 family)